MQASEQRGDNPIETGASCKARGGAICDHAVVHAKDLSRASQSRKSAAQQQGKNHVTLNFDARITRSMWILSHRADAISKRGAPQKDVNQNGKDNRDQSAKMQTSGSQTRQAENFLQSRSLGNLRSQLRLRRIDHRSTQEEVHQLHGNGIHHHRAKDFIDAEICFEHTRNTTPNCTAQKSCQHGQG